MPEDTKTAFDKVVELALFAPVGLAVTARDHLPEMIARGREQVRSQITFARVMGRYAVKQGEQDLRDRLGDLTDAIAGPGPLDDGDRMAATSPRATPAPMPESPAPASGATNGSIAAASRSNGHAATPAEGQPAAGPRSRAELSIPGYDTLSASQVVQRLAGLSAAELEDVRDYESGTRGRRTILSKISQLQTGPSA